MLTVKEKLAAIRAKRLGLAPATSGKPTAEPTGNDATTAAEPAFTTERPNEHVDKSPHKVELSASTPNRAKRPPVSSLFQSPSPANTPTPVRARRFRNDPRAARMHWRKKELARARRHVVRSAINSDQYVYMTAPVPDEEKTPIVLVKAEGDDDDDDGDDDDYNGEDDENGEGADGEDDEEIALRTARELEKMRDSDEDVNNDNEDTEDFNDYDVNNYDNREDDEPENDVNGILVIRNEVNNIDENDKLDANNDSDHVQEKEDLASSISNPDVGNINEKTGEGDTKNTASPTNAGGSEISKSQGDAHEKVSDIADQDQNSEVSPEEEGSNDKAPTSPAAQPEQRGTVQEQSSILVDVPGEEVSKAGSTTEVTEKSDCKGSESKPANFTKTTAASTMVTTATTPTKKKKKQSKVQSVLSFSQSTMIKGKTADDKEKSTSKQEEVDERDDESSTMPRSEADSHVKALDELEDDESETVRRPREKPMISDDETEFVGGGRMFEDEAEEDDGPKKAMNDISDDDDDQAERYTDDDDDNRGVRRRNNDDDDDDDRDIDEIVSDTEQMEDEKVAMASFHRQWEMEQEKKGIEAATNGGVRRLFTESDELNDDPPVIAGSSDDPAPTTAGSHDAVASTQNDEIPARVCAEGQGDASDAKDQTDQKSAKKDASADYMEAMFRRDDSRSVVIEDAKLDEDEEAKQHEARREQQRLLWKARQKFKSEMHQSNDDSLCHLDLFGDANKSKQKSELVNVNLRKKLESACRPAAMRHDSGSVNDDDISGGKHKHDDGNRPLDKKNGKKRTAPGSSDDSALPDWLREKACLEKRQQKRRRSVAVANWSFDRLSTSKDKDRTSNGGVAATKTGNKSSTAVTSLGTTSNTVRKSRTTSGVTVSLKARQKRAAITSTRASSSAGNSRNSASFKGLLSLLGQQAERHA